MSICCFLNPGKWLPIKPVLGIQIKRKESESRKGERQIFLPILVAREKGRNKPCMWWHAVSFTVLLYYPVVCKMTTFNLWPLLLGGGAWGAGTNMWHPETPASYESLPAPLATQIPTLCIHTFGGRGRVEALILDRCRAFNLFASVDAHLCYYLLFSHSCPFLRLTIKRLESYAKCRYLKKLTQK